MRVLLRASCVREEDLKQVVVSGTFGTYLDLSSAAKVGMMPDLPLDRFRQVGNAAGIGVKYILLSSQARAKMNQIRNTMRHIELVREPDFQEIYLLELSFKN
jgi:uncharacterized 2Fe-2S/4Fe-4S cluster protein (DUF4445 family)